MVAGVVVTGARPSLTLDLEGQPRGLGLSLDLGASQPVSDVEVDLPLERQGYVGTFLDANNPSSDSVRDKNA